MLKTEDIHPPKTGISVHFSCFLVCQVHPYQRLNVITFNVFENACPYTWEAVLS